MNLEVKGNGSLRILLHTIRGKLKMQGYPSGHFPGETEFRCHCTDERYLALLSDQPWKVFCFTIKPRDFIITFGSTGPAGNPINKRETFLLGFSGYVTKGLLFYQHHFVMTHLAHSMNVNIDEHIRDNAGLTIMPGADLTQITPLDSLTVSAGSLLHTTGCAEFMISVSLLDF